MKTRREILNHAKRRHNRRHDGVTTIPSTPERQQIEESQLKVQWNEFWHENAEYIDID